MAGVGGEGEGSLCTLCGTRGTGAPCAPAWPVSPPTATSSSRLWGQGEAGVGLVPPVSALALLYLGFFLPFAVLPGLWRGGKQQLEQSEGYDVQANKCGSLAGTS